MWLVATMMNGIVLVWTLLEYFLVVRTLMSQSRNNHNYEIFILKIDFSSNILSNNKLMEVNKASQGK